MSYTLTRGLHPDTLAALAGHFFPAVLVYDDWAGTDVYAHTGAGAMSWDGQTWVGVSGYGGLDIPAEGPGTAAPRAKIRLAVPFDEVEATMTADIRNRVTRIYGAVTTERMGSTLIGDAFEVFNGTKQGLAEFEDVIKDDDDGREVQTTIEVELSGGPPARASATVVHSNEDQSQRFPADTIGRLWIGSEDRQRKVIW